MIKYLSDPCLRLTKFKQGMEANPTVWAGQPETPATLQTRIDALNAKEKEIEDMKALLVTKQAEGHSLGSKYESDADRIESMILGLEENTVEKLNPYGITLRKSPERKTVPATTLHPTIQDDTDGVGFILTILPDAAADNYEWQKGTASDVANTNLIPPMQFFKMTPKVSFVDDDVAKGIRVFYRVRAVNRAGSGPWSEAVSKVQ